MNHIVCLGGGIGSVNLIKGLLPFSSDITVVHSMGDDGGSSGRLRRLYTMMPVGDIVSCMASLVKEKNPLISELLTYRFEGDRYGKDGDLAGHKLGNLIMKGLIDVKGDVKSAITTMKELFEIPGNFLPATLTPVTLSAVRRDGKIVESEETIDLGKHDWEKGIETVRIHPKDVAINPDVVTAIQKADTIIVGPGDLYTTLIPVLLVPGIVDAVVHSSAKKVFVVNVTNKPFETKSYTVSSYLQAVVKHVKQDFFTEVIVNNNFSNAIPNQYEYEYVKNDCENDSRIIAVDVVNSSFPLYHDPSKLAKVIADTV